MTINFEDAEVIWITIDDSQDINMTIAEQGPAGPAGATGAGMTGASGPRGLTGASGASGFTGATGPRGFTGETGPVGSIGSTGPAGIDSNSVVSIPALICTPQNVIDGFGGDPGSITNGVIIYSDVPIPAGFNIMIWDGTDGSSANGLYTSNGNGEFVYSVDQILNIDNLNSIVVGSDVTFPSSTGTASIYSVGTNDGTTFGLRALAGGVFAYETGMAAVTHAELLDLKNNSGLVIGRSYFITDFQTIYDRPDYNSAGAAKASVSTVTCAVENIIVRATDNDQLASEALSTQHVDDKLLYDVSVISTEVMGAPMKGRIIERIDDLGRKTNYDHRHITFKRYETAPGSGVFTVINDNSGASVTNIPTFGSGCYNIEVNNFSISSNAWGFYLPNNIFGADCYNITTGNNFYNNWFGPSCYNISTDNDFYNRIITGINNQTIIDGLSTGLVRNESGYLRDTTLGSALSLTSGNLNVVTAQLGTGTASSTTFLRGDQAWASLGEIGAYKTTTELVLPGVNSQYAYTPDTPFIDITGDIDIRMNLSLTDWTPSQDVSPLSKWGAPGFRSWYLRITSLGKLGLAWSSNGTDTVTGGPVLSTVSSGITDGVYSWVRATLTVNNGSSQNEVRFYTSTDGVTWTQLGATVTNAGTTSIFSSSSDLSIGVTTGFTSVPMSVKRVTLHSTIGGTTPAPFDVLFNSGAANSRVILEVAGGNSALIFITGLQGVGALSAALNSDPRLNDQRGPLWAISRYSDTDRLTAHDAKSAGFFQIGTMTAARTVALPALAEIGTGKSMLVYSGAGCSATNTLTVQAYGTETINGTSSSYVITEPNRLITFYSNVLPASTTATSPNWVLDAGASSAAGATGATGPQGLTGPSGAAGAAGASGTPGAVGATGVGATGATGVVGATGPSGSNADTSALTTATGEPTGFPSRTTSTVSFNNTTRKFTITPVSGSFKVWCAGTEYTISSAQEVTIPNTTGLYYIFFEAGVLGYQTSYFVWESQAPVSYVYWNQTTQKAEFFADERHGTTLDWATHEYLHRTRGAALASGFSLSGYVVDGNGNEAAHAQFGLSGGTFFDEDLEVAITSLATPTPNTWEQVLDFPAEIPMFYMIGTEWRMDAPNTYAVKAGTARIRYNSVSGGAWGLTDVSQSDWGITWIVATNNLNYPILAIMGQGSYGSLPATRSVGWEDLTLTNLPIVEMRPLWKLAFQTASTYTNVPHARLREVTDIRGAISTGAGTTVTDHGLLAGLADNDHPQYALSNDARFSNWNWRNEWDPETAYAAGDAVYYAPGGNYGGAWYALVANTNVTPVDGANWQPVALPVTGNLPITVASNAVSISAATTSAAGSMSAADKTILDSLNTGYKVISKTTFASATASVDINPTGYSNIKIVLQGRGDSAASSVTVRMRLNGSSGPDYLINAATSPATTFNNNGSFPGSLTNTNRQGYWECDFAIGGVGKYTVGVQRGVHQLSNTGVAAAVTQNALFFTNDSAAITSILVFPSADNFAIGSKITVLGLV